MSDSEKCKLYKDTQSSISKLQAKGLGVDKNVYMNQLLLIKRDINANDENVRKAALDMLDFLLSLNVEDINSEVIKILLDSSVNKIVQNCILKSIKKKIRDIISKDKFDFTEILFPWKNQNVNKLTNIVEEVCLNDLPRDKCKNFFICEVIPTMMDTGTDSAIRDMLTDMAFMLSTIVAVSDLSPKELDTFLKEVNTKYVKSIGDLRDLNYANWHNLWIFLVRFCDKNIHSSMELTNKLLRVVEYAFRNSSIQQRLKGYDCWKELIDNASLDMNHMCSNKQIKLLVTPLKAKFSKQEVVICKRFDVFVYLLEKLQHKAVLCLTEFLEFCFGPLGTNIDASKVGQGKTVPQIWTKSTKVLVDIIGHSHSKSVSCVTTEDVIKLENPVINYSNLSSYYKVIINSVGECCSLLKEVDIESKRETVIKCMWKSVFNLIIPTADELRTKYFEAVSQVLDKYIKECRENPYFEDLLLLIFTVLMSYDKEFVHEVFQYILKQLLTILFITDNFPKSVADSFKQVLSHAFSKILMVENKLMVIKEIMMCFTKVAPNEENIPHLNKIWMCVTNEFASDFTVQQIEGFAEFDGFFMWPAFHLHYLENSAKKQTVLYWMKLYRKLSLDSEEKKLSVMKELEKIFKNNPLLSADVVSLLNVMSQFETKFTKEFVIKLMEVSSLILLLPNLKTEDEQKITALVMQYFEPSLECYKSEDNEEVIKNICICIEHILCIHKGYKLLDTLATFIKICPTDIKMKFTHYLSDLLLDLYNKESDSKGYNARELHKVLQVFSAKNDDKSVTTPPFVAPAGRSARIANLAKNSPRSSRSKSRKVEPSPTALRLFGKDLDTSSPLHVKGSQLKNMTPGKSKRTSTSPKSKKKNAPSISEENSEDFVPIHTEVKFQPEKLSRHQREALKRRREDIPALYQDLSQSLSHDMFSSSSSVKDLEKDDKENSSDNRKVIVEVIAHHLEHKVETPFEFPEVIPTQFDVPNAETKSEGDLFASEVEVKIPNQEVKSEDLFVPEVNVKVSNQEVKCDGDVFNSEVDKMTSSEEMAEKVNETKSEDVVTENLDVRKEEVVHDKSETPEKDEIQAQPQTERKRSDSEDEKQRRKKMKMEAELQKLKMDIVGADQFLTTTSRTRTREKPKKLQEGEISKADKLPSQQLQHSRKSLTFDKPESKIEKTRRKTIGSTKDITSPKTSEVEKNKTEPAVEVSQTSKEKVNLGTPKTPRRRTSKAKAVSKEVGKQLDKTEEEAPSVTTNMPESIDKEGDIVMKENKETKDKKGHKRKRSIDDEDSEDIIESSQESRADVTPIFNSSKRKNFSKTSEDEKLDKSEDKTIVQEKTITMEDFTPSVENKVEKVKDNGGLSDNSIFVDRVIAEEIKDDNAVMADQAKTDFGVIAEEINGDNAIVEDEAKTDFRKVEATDVSEEVPVQMEEVGQEIEIGDITEETDNITLEQKVGDMGEQQQELDTTQDTTITQNSTQDISGVQDISQNQSQEMETQDTETQLAATQDTQTQDTPSDFCVSSEENRPPVLYFDLPKKPELTNSERIMCHMDTMSICFEPNNLGARQNVEEAEIKGGILEKLKDDKLPMEDILALPEPATVSDIPSSPITVETPNRTTELLNNTVDISPINSNSDGETTEDIPVSVARNLKAEMEELDRIEQEKDIKTAPKEITVTHEAENEAKAVQVNNYNDLPSTVEDIINILEGKSEESGKVDEVVQLLEEIQHESKCLHQTEEVVHQVEEVSHQTEEISYQIEEVPLQTEEVALQTEKVPLQTEVASQTNNVLLETDAIALEAEEVPRRLEEVPQGIKELACHDEEAPDMIVELPHEIEEIAHKIEEVQHRTEDVTQQIEDSPNQIETVKHAKENNSIQERASKLLNMVNISSPVTHRIFIKRRCGGLTLSPSTGRIKRLLSGISQKECTEKLVGDVKEDDILTFSREVPSPLAVPRSSILKRKLSDTSDTEGISPCSKRKRVNFSDPCLTSKKVFIKDEYHEHTDLEAKSLSSITQDLKMKEERPNDMPSLLDTSDSSEKLTETENIETEPSLEIVNPLILRKDRPIYPKLVDCKEDVMLILKRVTSPMFVSMLMNRLKSKNIKTIGDLAKQTEAEINRFPFKVPVVANVHKALDNYYKKNIDKSGRDGLEDEHQLKANSVEESRKDDAAKRTSPVKIRSKFMEIIEKSNAEGATEDLARMLLPSLEKEQVLALVNAQYKIEPKDFLQEKDFKSIIKHIIETVGLPSIFEMVTESVANSENESVYIDCMIKHSINKRPLVNFLEHRSLDDVKRGLEEGISKNMFNKQAVLDTCLVPLIQSPSDISSYLNKISIVQLGDILISRLECTDLKQFFSRIIEAHGRENVVKTLNSELYNGFSSVSEIVDSIKNCISVQNEERRNEVMVEVFKFISSNLKLNTLVELHIDFLKRIPNIVTNCEEK